MRITFCAPEHYPVSLSGRPSTHGRCGRGAAPSASDPSTKSGHGVPVDETGEVPERSPVSCRGMSDDAPAELVVPVRAPRTAPLPLPVPEQLGWAVA